MKRCVFLFCVQAGCANNRSMHPHKGRRNCTGCLGSPTDCMPLLARLVARPTSVRTTRRSVSAVTCGVRHQSTLKPRSHTAWRLAPPRSNTHEGLAYANCFMCGLSLHMCDMYLHLTNSHKDLDPDLCKRVCEERLALYQSSMGVPLEKLVLKRTPEGVLAFLPTVTGRGYACNWCVVRKDVYSTRDAFLKHVCDEHPDIDLSEVEKHVPAISITSAAASAAAMSSHTDHLRYSSPLPASRSTSSEEVAASMQTTGPTRRMAGVRTVPEEFVMPKQSGRHLGIAVPRGLDQLAGFFAKVDHGKPPDVSGGGHTPMVFTDSHFPCELCGRAFTTEVNLLQHLEGKHPDGTVNGTNGKASDAEASSASADIAKYMRQEAAASPGGNAQPGQMFVVCDLCSSSKVYTLPSALFAHIRFKHPQEDATQQVERLIEEQRVKQAFPCPHCHRGFVSQVALDGHLVDKHSSVQDLGKGEKTATGTSLPPATLKNRWWCHECEKGFGAAKGLHGHMVGKHQLSTQVYPCPACKRIFTDVYSLEEHIHVQHKSLDPRDLGLDTHVSCDDCGRWFLQFEDLHRHAVKHHRKDPRAPIRPFEAAPRESPSATTITEPSANQATESDTTRVQAPRTPRKVVRKKVSG